MEQITFALEPKRNQPDTLLLPLLTANSEVLKLTTADL